FNNQVSILRIRSEHAIGYLKGRFQSLKNLRVDIRDARTHKLATYWIVSCIGIHAFAMKSEARSGNPTTANFTVDEDPFLAEGLSDSEEATHADPVGSGQQIQGTSERLRRGKRFREMLKAEFARHQERRAERYRQRRM
ncbi:hypothetical protein EV122DRAFT_211792, partial [Schizophyllum commune]